MKGRTRIILLLSLSGLLIGGASLALIPSRKEITYKDKPVSKWFCNQRKDFFNKTRIDAADDAFKALGTNALPFLLSNLKNRGSSVPYFKFYQIVPKRFQTWLPYPISGDDIQVMTLSHLKKMEGVPPEWLAELAKQVPNLRNPTVRLSGLMTVHRLAGGRQDRSFIDLCKNLLDDGHFGIRLRAAELLADVDPEETRSLPILLGALEDKEKLNSSHAIGGYRFQQPPGGSGSKPVTPFTGQTPGSLEEAQRRMVLDALEKLKPHLNAQQKRLVRKYKDVSEGRRR